MNTLKLRSRTAPDGTITFQLPPEAANQDLELILIYQPTASEPATLEVSSDPITLMQLPLEQRRKILEQQANRIAHHYEENTDWREFTAGDFIDY